MSLRRGDLLYTSYLKDRFLGGLVAFKIILIPSLCAASFSLNPITHAACPHTLLPNPLHKGLHYVGDKTRYSLCTGVAWFPGASGLISLNWLEGSLQTFRFSLTSLTAIPSEFFPDTDLHHPENLKFSRDNSLLLIPQTGYINLYSSNEKTQSLTLLRQIRIKKDAEVHGASFSPDMRHIVSVTIGEPGQVSVHQLLPNFQGRLTYTQQNPYAPLKPKGVDFSPDGKWVVIGYSPNAKFQETICRGALAIYQFDAERGTLSPFPLSWIENDLLNPEDVQFFPDGCSFFVSNQSYNTITAHDFDSVSGQILNTRIALKNPDAELSFPHGIAFSQNGEFLAVSNYGDDSITIYQKEPPP